jgi:hypothetical protein
MRHKGHCKTRNETETKQNDTKQAEAKRNETRHNRNEIR